MINNTDNHRCNFSHELTQINTNEKKVLYKNLFYKFYKQFVYIRVH